MGVQEPKLTTFETSKTPLTLLVAFPKHSESEHRPKVMRCGHKPPEETALTGEAPPLPSAHQLYTWPTAWQHYLSACIYRVHAYCCSLQSQSQDWRAVP